MEIVRSLSVVEEALARIAAVRIIPVIRANSAEDALWGSRLLIEAGFTVLEVTLTVPDAVAVIETLCDEAPSVLVGAGSVMGAVAGIKALGAGAGFLVSPVLDEAMVEWSVEHQVLAIPGAATPSEIHRAFCLGAPAVKVFPAKQVGGPAFLKAIGEPFSAADMALPLIPTGGVALNEVGEYLKAGALAVGLGGAFVSPELLARKDKPAIFSRIETLKAELSRG